MLSASASLCIYFYQFLGMLFVCRDAFVKYWVDGNMLTMDVATQIFNILKQPDYKYLTQVCLVIPIVSLCICWTCCIWLPVNCAKTAIFFFLVICWWTCILSLSNSWLYTGRLQACSSRTFGNTSRVGIFAEHTWISRKIWHVLNYFVLFSLLANHGNVDSGGYV